MALTNEELQQILSGLSPEEQKALFEKLRQNYGDTPTPQPHPNPLLQHQRFTVVSSVVQ